MKLDIYIANPAGNITIFVKNDVNQDNYIEIANKLINLKEYKAEQVAFIKELNNKPYKMEMMGLEFCANASRSFAYLVARENNIETPTIINVDVSGIKSTIDVEVDLDNNDATIEMNPPQDIKTISINDINYPLVIMEGIMHVIIEESDFDKTLCQQILNFVLEKYSVDALGFMFVDNNEMYPVVYVHDTKTLIHEGSCGSGSIAYAYYLYNKLQDKTNNYAISLNEPGGILKVSIINEKCYLSGELSISKLTTVEI
ncbi:diaminopimelate epimerase [Bacilli bacterium PM5-9]|nr:diaminopimelate epimerase [Bacilli bacterium PM5-9]